MNRFARVAFFAVFVRPLLMLVLGFHVRGRENLPKTGPAIIAANHNSHLDTLTLMALFPLRDLPRLRPAAAADYFMRSKWLSWFALNIIGIIPLERGGVRKNPLADLEEALDRGDILILFPEGSRGEPEQMTKFKRGLAFLAKARPQTPIIPVFMHGLGKALPKGSLMLVPFNCDVFVGAPFHSGETPAATMALMQERMEGLAAEGGFQPWT